MGYLGGDRQCERLGDAFLVQIDPDRRRISYWSHVDNHHYQASGPRRNYWLTSIWHIPKHQAEASRALSVAAAVLILELRHHRIVRTP